MPDSFVFDGPHVRRLSGIPEGYPHVVHPRHGTVNIQYVLLIIDPHHNRCLRLAGELDLVSDLPGYPVAIVEVARIGDWNGRSAAGLKRPSQERPRID